MCMRGVSRSVKTFMVGRWKSTGCRRMWIWLSVARTDGSEIFCFLHIGLYLLRAIVAYY
jgi:hypothetical protein